MVEHGPGFVPFGFHLFWMMGLLAVVVVTVLLIVLAVRASSRNAYPAGAVPPPASRETPLEILARRFASGEITAEEYQRARDLLGGGGKT
ncbi:MAG TPA: SHOCT domain-containing protein [Candidatus Dormibacteraeota bacterium]|jgi:uncharacterized membrane protein|nr:SHOCT domain-containing protein [Candidatus Dormibacteraeota bacterium]